MIVTISREFGSGGRELGKRLSDVLEIPCYDKEIIQMIAEKQGFDEQYVSHVSEKNLQAAYPLTIGRRFTMAPHPVAKQAVAIAVEQQKIIENFAKQGDYIIIGRCADVILKDDSPFNIFVYADMDTKLKRCMERGPKGEDLSSTELERKIREVDRERTKHREFYTGAKGNIRSNYHLCINTSDIEIKKIVPVVAEYIKIWFQIRS
ncbi:MAG: cytidylate kinase-like family protein [Lachnospiraceae bacterium]|nr:cytidylate kinase-like family protein [Lachnospiraceae bacterium]